jgi:protein involved in polysaccharide export with SLBB domain
MPKVFTLRASDKKGPGHPFFCFMIALMILSQAGCGGRARNPSTLPLLPSDPNHEKEMNAYRLQPGDNLDIKLFYNPELNENVTIRPDGKISLQLIDEINAAGMTPAQLDDFVTRKYSSELRNAAVSVILKSFGGQRIYVGGEVNSPKEINPVGRINALQAIVSAGGLKDDAELRSVIIVSRGPDKKPSARIVNLKEALIGELAEEAYLLKPFDMVYVPKTRLAKADQFITHIYNFIPPRVGLGFSYELHSEDEGSHSENKTNNFSFDLP